MATSRRGTAAAVPGSMAIDGVILDLDGTLVDANEAHVLSWHEALEHFALGTSLDDVRRLVGMGGDQLLPAISGLEKESELGEAITTLKKAIFREKYLADIQPWPGTRELLVRLRGERKRLVVASSSDREDVTELLARADPDRIVREIVSGSDVASSKPAPDLVLSALARLSLPGERVAMLGDTPYDVAAALPLGVSVIGFRCGGFSDDDLGGALEVWDGPEDLLDHFTSSILGGRGEARRAA